MVEEARDTSVAERANDGDRRTGRNVTGNLDEVSLSLLSASVDRYIPYRGARCPPKAIKR